LPFDEAVEVGPLKLTKAQWDLRYRGVWKILDPDGWDRRPGHYERQVALQITRSEYIGRALRSTLNLYRIRRCRAV